MEENEKKNFYGKKTAKLSFGYKRFTILVRSSSVVWVGTKVSSEKKTVENCTNVLQQPMCNGLKSILKDHSSNLKVEKKIKDSLDSISSPSLSVKIQIMLEV